MLHYGLLWEIEVGGRKYGFDKVREVPLQSKPLLQVATLTLLDAFATQVKVCCAPAALALPVRGDKLSAVGPGGAAHREKGRPVPPPTRCLRVQDARACFAQTMLFYSGLFAQVFAPAAVQHVQTLHRDTCFARCHAVKLQAVSRARLRAADAPAESLQGLELLKDLLSIEVPLTLNEAMCDHHRKHCPKSEELDRECGKVGALHTPDARYRSMRFGRTVHNGDVCGNPPVLCTTCGHDDVHVLIRHGATLGVQSVQLFAGGEGCGRARDSTEEFAGWHAMRRLGQEVP